MRIDPSRLPTIESPPPVCRVKCSIISSPFRIVCVRLCSLCWVSAHGCVFSLRTVPRGPAIFFVLVTRSHWDRFSRPSPCLHFPYPVFWRVLLFCFCGFSFALLCSVFPYLPHPWVSFRECHRWLHLKYAFLVSLAGSFRDGSICDNLSTIKSIDDQRLGFFPSLSG